MKDVADARVSRQKGAWGSGQPLRTQRPRQLKATRQHTDSAGQTSLCYDGALANTLTLLQPCELGCTKKDFANITCL